MIIYFKNNIKSNKDKGELIKSLDKLLFKSQNEYIAIFPLCLLTQNIMHSSGKKENLHTSEKLITVNSILKDK